MLGQDDEVDQGLRVAAVLATQGDTRQAGSAPPGPHLKQGWDCKTQHAPTTGRSARQ